MSLPHHVSYSVLLSTTGLQVNTSSKPSESIHYYRVPCHHLAIYLNLFYYLLHVYRSTRCQNPQNHTNATGHHITTSSYISFSTTIYHRSTGQHVVKTPRIIPIPQVTMSPPRHISHSLLLSTTGLQINTSLIPSQNIPLLQVIISPPHHISLSLILPTTGLQVNMSAKPSELYHYYRSPCHHLAIYPILKYTSPPDHM